MSALTSERNTPARDGRDFEYPVAAGVKIFQGSLVMMGGGYAKPGVVGVGLVGVGRAKETVDNTGGAAGALTVPVERGCFRFANAGDVTLAHVGLPGYVVDDQTVSSSHNTNTRSQGGVIREVDVLGVWLEI
jgi:hypothetical protein